MTNVRSYPNRFIEQTQLYNDAMRTLGEFALKMTKVNTHQLVDRLFELLFYECYGNIYTPVSIAYDAIAVVKKNKIALIWRKTNRGIELALCGGFHDIDKNPGESFAMEVYQELHGNRELEEHLQPYRFGWLPFAADNARRDPRFHIISLVGACMVCEEALVAGSDASGIVLVDLVENGLLNTRLFEPGSWRDLNGKMVNSVGLRSDHQQILQNLFYAAKAFGFRNDLAGYVEQLSNAYHQDEFNYTPTPEEHFDRLEISPDMVIPEYTTNLQYFVGQTQRILKDHLGTDNDTDRAVKELMFSLVKQGILPAWPQPAITVDTLIVDGNSVWCHQLDNGDLVLPGTFLNTQNLGVDVFYNPLSNAARRVANQKYGMNVTPKFILNIGGSWQEDGQMTDPRYPRVTVCIVCVRDNSWNQPGDNVHKVTLLNSNGNMSKELADMRWGYNHLSLIDRFPGYMKLLRSWLFPNTFPTLDASDVLAQFRL